MKSDNTKITVVVNGRFHAFDYASELYKKGLLVKLISTMPYSVAKKFGIGKEVYSGLTIFEIMKRSWRIVFRKELPVLFYSKIFTKSALLFVPKRTNVLIGFAGYSKEIFESKKFDQTIKILDRGSTHTLANIRLNSEAARYHNVEWRSNPKKFIDRELREYEISNKILVPSSFVRKSFVDNGIKREKIIQIPYAFSPKKFKVINNVVEKNKNTILFVGQLSPRKGIGVLLKSFEIVKGILPDSELWLVGALNSKISKAKLQFDGIKYFGVLKGEELMDKYQRATIFCLPSFEEGLALVLTEANNFNLPIIATLNSGVEDLVTTEDSLYLVPPGDHIFLADKIIEALTKHNTRTMINNSKTMTWKDFSEQLIRAI